MVGIAVSVSWLIHCNTCAAKIYAMYDDIETIDSNSELKGYQWSIEKGNHTIDDPAQVLLPSGGW